MNKTQQEAYEKIGLIVERAAKEVKALAVDYPECGIGDTATDSDIGEMFYHALHYSELSKEFHPFPEK